MQHPLFPVLKLILTPILRYCLRNALTLNLIVEATKETLVELAVLTLKETEDKATTSRVSVMTGMHRPDVRRILERDKIEIQPRPFNVIARVLSHWEQDPKYSAKSNKTKILQFEQFQTLVESITKDVGYRVVLKELIRLGYVEETSKGLKLCQVQRRFSDDTADEGFGLLSRDTVALCEAVEENLLVKQEPRNLHTKTIADNIYLDAIPEIRTWLLSEGAEFHKKVRAYLSKFDKDLNPDPDRQGGGNVIVCAFSLSNLATKEISVPRK